VPFPRQLGKLGKRATSNFLPSDAKGTGSPIWHELFVTFIIKRRAEWYKLIGYIDFITSTILENHMVYPRLTWPLHCS
jgi:hypothetical protein